jgi:hypothetical protein
LITLQVFKYVRGQALGRNVQRLAVAVLVNRGAAADSSRRASGDRRARDGAPDGIGDGDGPADDGPADVGSVEIRIAEVAPVGTVSAVESTAAATEVTAAATEATAAATEAAAEAAAAAAEAGAGAGNLLRVLGGGLLGEDDGAKKAEKQSLGKHFELKEWIK